MSRLKRINHEESRTNLWTFGSDKGMGVVYVPDLRNCFLVDIEIPADYPFKPPKLKVHDTEISVLNLLRHSVIAKEVREVTGYECLCCEYVECGDKWSPVMTIDKVLGQATEFLKFKNQALLRYFCKKILAKNNVTDDVLQSICEFF